MSQIVLSMMMICNIANSFVLIIVVTQAHGARNIFETNELLSVTVNTLQETQNALRKNQEDLLLLKNELELLKIQCATADQVAEFERDIKKQLNSREDQNEMEEDNKILHNETTFQAPKLSRF